MIKILFGIAIFIAFVGFNYSLSCIVNPSKDDNKKDDLEV